MAIPSLAEDASIVASDANAAFDLLDGALKCLFAGCSPILWLGLAAYQTSGMCGVPFVFGTQANRKLLDTVESHDQSSIDADVAAATLGSQDDARKQVTADLATGALGASLVAHQRTVTPGGGGADEDYWVRVPLVTGWYQHEHPHELAVAEVIFEGHASRAFTWDAAWNKFRCLRFHNLDPDATPLVVTIGETADEITIPRWSAVTVRRSADGSAWEVQGFLLFRMRDEDVARFGRTLAWNDRSAAIGNATHTSVWVADAANNVASFASVWRWLDYWSAANTPPEILDVCGAGLADAFEPRTGIHFDLSDITRNSYLLPQWPDPTDAATPLYALAWHGGQFYLYRKPLAGDATIITATASLSDLITGHAASGLQLTIASGTSARLHLITETGQDYVDFIPVSTNFGASGHPFTIEADGVGYAMPNCPIGGPDIRRLVVSTASETVTGIGTTETTDYDFLEIENAWSGVAVWSPWSADIGDVQGWAFPDATTNNDHGTFLTKAVKWDGRRLAINAQVRIVPDAGACPESATVAHWSGGTATVITSLGYLDWYQAAVVQDWPPKGGVWLVREYRRRKIAQLDPSLYHPHTSNPLGNASGDDWSGMDTTRFPTGHNIARQTPLDAGSGFSGVESAPLSDSFLVAPDSTDTILANIGSKGAAAVAWWEANRADAIAGDEIGSEVRPVIAVPLMARHWNVLATRLNAVLEVVPFSFLDAQWYGRPFRPSQPGIFDGHIYPEGFLCLATGTAATRAGDLGISVTDFRTAYSGFASYADDDLDSALAEDDPYSHPEAFRVSGAGGINLWNTDLPLWFRPEASITPKERTIVSADDPGDLAAAGWVQGELAGQLGIGVDHYWYWKPNASAYDYPDFEYITLDAVISEAASLGIPMRFLRLSATYDLVICTPDGSGDFGVRKSLSGAVEAFSSVPVARQDLRLVPGIFHHFEAFAGTAETWGGAGLVRVSDWPIHPDAATFYGTTDATCRLSVASPMQNLDRGAGMHPHPWSATTWRNDDPFDGEAPRVRVQVWDTTPTAPSGWSKGDHRLASYPVPITHWGATDIESHGAPAVDPQWHSVGSLGEFIDAGDLWSAAAGSGAWSGEGAFAVHLVSAGYRPS